VVTHPVRETDQDLHACGGGQRLVRDLDVQRAEQEAHHVGGRLADVERKILTGRAAKAVVHALEFAQRERARGGCARRPAVGLRAARELCVDAKRERLGGAHSRLQQRTRECRARPAAQARVRRPVPRALAYPLAGYHGLQHAVQRRLIEPAEPPPHHAQALGHRVWERHLKPGRQHGCARASRVTSVVHGHAWIHLLRRRLGLCAASTQLR
jgi:hypothetical protein